MTRLAARLGALFAGVPGRPSLVETASLAMFSIVGATPLIWPTPSGTGYPVSQPDAQHRASGSASAAGPRVTPVRSS